MESKKARFLKIGCPRCHAVQVVYGNSTLKVKCERCNYMLLRTRGGKARIKAPVIEVLWN